MCFLHYILSLNLSSLFDLKINFPGLGFQYICMNKSLNLIVLNFVKDF